MILTKNNIDKKAEQITFNLICWAGLRNAKRVTKEVRHQVKSVKQVMKLVEENLRAEEQRRKGLEK